MDIQFDHLPKARPKSLAASKQEKRTNELTEILIHQLMTSGNIFKP